MPTTATDGSSARDARPLVEIDSADPRDRWRFKCPNNHTTWEPTNGGVWCYRCAQDPDVDDPHYHELWDAKRHEAVAWADVVFR